MVFLLSILSSKTARWLSTSHNCLCEVVSKREWHHTAGSLYFFSRSIFALSRACLWACLRKAHSSSMLTILARKKLICAAQFLARLTFQWPSWPCSCTKKCHHPMLSGLDASTLSSALGWGWLLRMALFGLFYWARPLCRLATRYSTPLYL